jgi:poly(A) polymerase
MTPPSAAERRRERARAVVARLQAAGHAAFWVGGCVRDRWLGREPLDYDVATSARPAEIEALFPRTIPVGRQFGVVIVRSGGFEYQVSTFRAEGPYADGRRPSTVQFTDAREDALRRDLTVNGLFYDPIRDTLHDWVDGLEDLRAGLIRTIGDPGERLGEDSLRLLRVPRFAAQLGFDVEAGTLAAVRARAAEIQRVSAERIRDELVKLFAPPHAAVGLEWLRQTGLLIEVLPEVAAFETCEQSPDYHPEGTVYEHVRRMLALLPCPAPELLPWAVLLHDVGKPGTATRDPASGSIRFYGHDRLGAELTEAVMTRLRFSRHEVEDTVVAVRHHMQFKDVAQMRQSTRRRMILRPTFPLELELHRLDCLGSHGSLENYELMRRELEAMNLPPSGLPPLVNGRDLIALGLPPGPALGAMLAEIRERQLQEELRTRDDALAWVKEKLGAGRGQG